MFEVCKVENFLGCKHSLKWKTMVGSSLTVCLSIFSLSRYNSAYYSLSQNTINSTCPRFAGCVVAAAAAADR